MLKPRVVSPAPSHEEIFVKRYELMLGWALRLTGQRREQAEDLVHDCFIQFTLGCDHASISNIEGYLYAMLKNLHLARIRQAAQFQDNTLSVLDYDSAELSLQAVDDIRARMQVQDDLRRVCHYASLRKGTSKAGSVLILRFFHGYYPAEIALILRSSRQGVEKRLKLARSEAKLYLDDPARLKFIAEPLAEKTPVEVEANRPARGETTIDFLRELRQMIFRALQGNCLSEGQLKEIYLATEAEPTECSELAHIVSCARCLDQVNNLLGLAPLADRYPTDMLGPDTHSRDDDDGPQGTGGSGTGGPGDGNTRTQLALRRYRRGIKQVVEHSPKELRIAVNGFLLGSQRVSSELSEQTLSVKGEERIGFVEIFSEQRVRLLFLSVEPPPDGEAEQGSRVALSEGRTLDAALKFGTPWPTLHVVYHDPLLKAEGERMKDEGGRTKAEVRTMKDGVWAVFHPFAFILHPFIFRPATVTAIVAVLLVSVVVFIGLRERVPAPTTATGLLARSAAAEDAAAARPEQVLHRTINLEERSTTGKLIAQRRIEVWQSAERGITARRLYDERGALVAGDWTRKEGETDGSRTIYRSHKLGDKRATEESESAIGNRQLALGNVEVWQLSPSAKEFTSLIEGADSAHFEERGTSYVISYEQQGTQAASLGLIKATLTLSRPDLHATELTLLVQGEDANRQSAIGNRQFREYRFVETSFERRPISAVAPAVFEPDAVLVGSLKNEGERMKDNVNPLSPLPFSPVPPVATAALEVEVLRLLNEAKADLGEQVTVTRAPGGPVQVQAMVETEARKAEILRALSSLSGNPAVRLQIETVAEALKHQRQTRSSSGPVAVERIESASNQNPIEQELHRYFAAKDANRTDEQVRRFADDVVGDSQQAMRHAWALKRLLNQFSPEDIAALSPEARSKWLALIHAHARAFEQGARRLRGKLAPIFFPSASGGDVRDESKTADDAELSRTTERLFALASANDSAIRSAFAFSTASASANAIKTPQFWESLKTAESLARKIVNSQ